MIKQTSIKNLDNSYHFLNLIQLQEQYSSKPLDEVMKLGEEETDRREELSINRLVDVSVSIIHHQKLVIAD